MSHQERLGDVVDDLQERVETLENRLDAMSTWNDSLEDRVFELEETNKKILARVAEIEAVQDTNPTSGDYDSLDRDTKVRKIRLALVEKAGRRGKAQMDYGEILALFDHNPSSGHAYTLMRLTSQLEGFEYHVSERGNNKVRVDLERVNDESLVSHANKQSPSEGS